ncbi:mitogen-activated protein kinase-binding protein 1-like isoform X2 [Anneissia japonica]|uniref:mitogen-activated protein kinase-binding protein 1-like isoform X2 n=1 Tax=Anneissia japonica TaxID=1529436 RepID=UPI00142559F9|nr:mitogen-activated protein kinase-binding protein 1-like isoform X2 [Anneissia japonica]
MMNHRPNSLNLTEKPSGSQYGRKVVKLPLPKKRSKAVPLSERVTLERVLGVTVKDGSALACDPNTGLIAYPAGCAVVLFNPRKNRQSFIINHSKKTITTLAFSADGKNLVTGESGHRPAVRIWDVQDKSQVVEFLGHKFGITCVAFSPNGKYVVSVGEQHDKTVNVWDWKGVGVVASGKISSKVKSLAFAENGSYFVTVGNRNVKFWYLSSKRKTREALPLLGRAGILGEQRNNFFGDVACGLGVNSKKTYCITNSGFLCEFNERRLLDKWVELRVSSANSIFATEEHVFVGCADGVIRCFDASTLHFVATLPRPHCLGVNVSDGIDPSHLSIYKEDANYPDAIALTFDDVNKKLTCVYNDHSVYIWDVHDVKMVGKQWSSLYHSSCIWGVEVYPTLGKLQKDTLPSGSFITCSSDDTIRVWNLNHTNANDVFKKNVYSNELMKVIYIDDEKTHLTGLQYNPTGQTDKTDTGEGKNGVRCLCITSDGQHLASGDRSGNVHVHDLVLMQEVKCIEAHDSEVLCLSYSNAESGHSLLASASRDRLVHVFNLEDDYSLVETIDDHSSSITAVSFADVNGQLELISSGADKALMCRKAIEEPSLHFVRSHHIVGKATFHDLAVDPTCKYVATASQDRSVKIHHLANGKLRNSYKGALAEDGTLIRIEIDPSGLYAATSCSDKSIAICDLSSGEFLATMVGHAELVTGIKFSNDCKHLYSVSGDGCIFVWKLPWGMTYSMKNRRAEIEALRNPMPEIKLTRRGTYVVPPENVPNQVPNTTLNRSSIVVDNALFQPATESMFPVEVKLQNNRTAELKETSPDYRFSVGQLPSWAKKQVMGGENKSSPSTYISPSQPKGRWAQRLDKGFKVKSDMHESIMLNLDDCMDRRRYTVEPDTISEQVSEFLNRLLTDENHTDANDEEINVNEDTFLAVKPRQLQTTSNVTLSRGCDPLIQPQEIFDRDSNSQWEPASSLDDQILELESLESQEKEFFTVEDEEEEEDDEEETTVIIYPTNGDAPPSPDSSTFQVTETSFIARKSRKSSKDKDELEVNQGQDPVGSGENSDDEDDEEDEDEEDDSRETSPTSKLEVNKGSETPQTPDEDDQKFLRTNYVFKEKALFGKCMEQLEAQFASDLDFPGRLSLSSKFLSKSQHSQIRGRVEPVSINFNKPVDPTEYLQRRKEDVARAVDETRKRLQALGWKSMKNADTTSDATLKRVGENLKDSDSVKKPKNVSKTNAEEGIVTSSNNTPNTAKSGGRVLQERDGHHRATPDHQRNLSDSSTTTEDDSPPSNEVEKENIKNRYEKKKVSNTSKNRMDRLKARREGKSNTQDLKKSQSMTDLRSPEDIEEDYTSNSPSKKLVQRYRTRSHSRDRKQFDDSCDTTKLKRRARSEQNLQATPSRPKRSYEAGTMSSMAKKISKTPPQSPTSKIMKGKSLENLHSVRRQSDPKVDPKSLSARNSPMHYKSTENISVLSKKAQQTSDDSKFLRRRSRSVSGEESSIDTSSEMNPKPSKTGVPEIKVGSGRPKSPRTTNVPRETSRSPPHIRSKPSSPTMVKKRQGKRASDYVNNNGSSDDNSTKDTLDKLVMPPPATRTVIKAKAVVYKPLPEADLKASLECLEKTTPQCLTSQIVNMNATHRDSDIPKKLNNVNDLNIADSINELPKTVSNISTVHGNAEDELSTQLETKQDKISLKDFSDSLAEMKSSFSKCLEMFTMVQSSSTTVDGDIRQSMIDMFSSTYQTMDQSAKEAIPTLRTSILREKRASTSPTPFAIANIESFRRSNRHSKRNGICSVDELESAATYSLLDQYSTMLVNMVQNKITANDKEKNVAIENGHETDSSSADDSTEKICYV